MIESHASCSLPLARFERVSLSYGSATVLKDVSFCVQKGEHIALLGKNGSGKSSLMRLLQGELRPSLGRQPRAGGDEEPRSPGKIYWAFEGQEERSALAAREHARLLSFEQQSNYVRRGWNITGEELLLSGVDNAPMVYGEVSSELYAAAARLAEEAGASSLLGKHAPAMSQGQLRLMLILRALMARPALLLLDEPFDGLDLEARAAVNRCLDLAAARGSTLVVSAHRRRDIPPFVSRAFLLQDGALQAVSLEFAKNFYDDARAKENEGTAAVQTSGRPRKKDFGDSPFLQALADKKSPLLRLCGVDVFIDRQKALSNINWQVEHGERWVISGPNGSGKSTLMRLLYAEEFAAWGGSLEWCGGLRPSQQELRAGVGFASDRLQYRYEYDISAAEVVVSGLRGSIGLYDEAEKEELEEARWWLELLDVASYAERPLHSLSGGTARKVLLARALAGSPPVLLLDEPCTGLDARSRRLFFDALHILARQGTTLIYASHREEDRAAFFNRELRLENGRVRAVL